MKWQHIYTRKIIMIIYNNNNNLHKENYSHSCYYSILFIYLFYLHSNAYDHALVQRLHAEYSYCLWDICYCCIHFACCHIHNSVNNNNNNNWCSYDLWEHVRESMLIHVLVSMCRLEWNLYIWILIEKHH